MAITEPADASDVVIADARMFLAAASRQPVIVVDDRPRRQPRLRLVRLVWLECFVVLTGDVTGAALRLAR